MGKKKMTIMIFLLGIIAIISCAICLIFPPSQGKVPFLTDKNGNRIADSIAEKIFIDVEDYDLGMIILSENVTNPVLLVCGGGPGISEYLMEYMYPSDLYKQFTVCYMDYRGTGLSYDSNLKTEEMTTDKYISDIVQVTKYLTERFSQEKIYIMGHSFGTYIAIKTVQQYPNYYKAYFAMSQNCNQKESEYMAYDYMKSQYINKGNKKMVARFEKCPIRESDIFYSEYFSSSLRDTAMHELGVGTTRDMDSVITGIFLPSLRCKAYTWKERINFWKGKVISRQFPVTNDSIKFNAFEDVTSLQIPIYFFAGKYDYTCNFDLQYRYYEQIDAPIKNFYVFDESAHSPIFEEPEKAALIFEEVFSE